MAMQSLGNVHLSREVGTWAWRPGTRSRRALPSGRRHWVSAVIKLARDVTGWRCHPSGSGFAFGMSQFLVSLLICVSETAQVKSIISLLMLSEK